MIPYYRYDVIGWRNGMPIYGKVLAYTEVPKCPALL